MKQMSEKYHTVVNSDQTLVNQLKNNDADAWAGLYSTYAPQISSFIIARGCNQSQAQDVVQETFIAFHNGIQKFDYNQNKGRLKSYILRIARTKMIDMYRKNKKYTLIDSADLFESLIHDDKCDHTTAYNEMQFDIEVISSAIGKVKGRVKTKTFNCFYDTFINGEKVARVAQEQSITPNLVSQHKHTVYKMVIDEAQQSIHGELIYMTA